jgi:hypothetical protein
MPGFAVQHFDFADIIFCESNKNRTLPRNLNMIFARVVDPESMERMYQPAAYNMHYPCFLPLTTSSYSHSYTGTTDQLARGKIFLEREDIAVNFCAQTTELGHISRLEKSKVDNYLEEIRIGSECLRSKIDLCQSRYKAGVMGSGSVYKVEENLEEAYAICDDTIDSLIDLYMAMLAQGVPYDLQLPDDQYDIFEDTSTGESIASITLVLEIRIIDECIGASQDNKSKGQFCFNEVLLGRNKLEEILEDVIQTMDTESLSLTYKEHCGAIILSLKHFHMSLVGQGVPVDSKGTDEGHLL